MAGHPIVHVDLTVNDPEKASAFYHDLFGWPLYKDEASGYHMFQFEEGRGGGFVKPGNGSKLGDVLAYVDCADIDATLARAASLGGQTLMPKTPIGEHAENGWFAVVADPTGNRMGLYTGPAGN
jgi:predicted enzyme related to lactoylglutathione lyase